MSNTITHLLPEQASQHGCQGNFLNKPQEKVVSYVDALVPYELKKLSDYSLEMKERDIETIRESRCIIVLTGLSGAGKTTMRKILGDLEVGEIVPCKVTRPLRVNEKGVGVRGRFLTEKIDGLPEEAEEMVFIERQKTGGYLYDLRDVGQHTLIADFGDQGAISIQAQKEQILTTYGIHVFQIWLTTPSANFDSDRFEGKNVSTTLHRIQPDELARYIPVEQKADIRILASLSRDQVADSIIREVAQKLKESD